MNELSDFIAREEEWRKGLRKLSWAEKVELAGKVLEDVADWRKSAPKSGGLQDRCGSRSPSDGN